MIDVEFVSGFVIDCTDTDYLERKLGIKCSSDIRIYIYNGGVVGYDCGVPKNERISGDETKTYTIEIWG